MRGDTFDRKQEAHIVFVELIEKWRKLKGRTIDKDEDDHLETIADERRKAIPVHLWRKIDLI